MNVAPRHHAFQKVYQWGCYAYGRVFCQGRSVSRATVIWLLDSRPGERVWLYQSHREGSQFWLPEEGESGEGSRVLQQPRVGLCQAPARDPPVPV